MPTPAHQGRLGTPGPTASRHRLPRHREGRAGDGQPLALVCVGRSCHALHGGSARSRIPRTPSAGSAAGTVIPAEPRSTDLRPLRNPSRAHRLRRPRSPYHPVRLRAPGCPVHPSGAARYGAHRLIEAERWGDPWGRFLFPFRGRFLFPFSHGVPGGTPVPGWKSMPRASQPSHKSHLHPFPDWGRFPLPAKGPLSQRFPSFDLLHLIEPEGKAPKGRKRRQRPRGSDPGMLSQVLLEIRGVVRF